jgi:anti-sigma factor RsiW
MVLSCKHVWREISNYIDGTVNPNLKAEVEKHLAHCRHCAAVLDSTRNILVLVADERTFELPVGFSERLHDKLSDVIASAAPGESD